MAIIVPTDVKIYATPILVSSSCFYTLSEHRSIIGFIVHGDICWTLQFPVGDTVRRHTRGKEKFGGNNGNKGIEEKGDRWREKGDWRGSYKHTYKSWTHRQLLCAPPTLTVPGISLQCDHLSCRYRSYVVQTRGAPQRASGWIAAVVRLMKSTRNLHPYYAMHKAIREAYVRVRITLIATTK